MQRKLFMPECEQCGDEVDSVLECVGQVLCRKCASEETGDDPDDVFPEVPDGSEGERGEEQGL